jgi:hypothetical protein
MELTEDQKQQIVEEEKRRLAEEQFRAQVRKQLAQEQWPGNPPSGGAETPMPVRSELPKQYPFVKVVLGLALCIVGTIIAAALSRQSSVTPKDSPPSIMYVPEQQPVSSGSIQVAALGTSSLRFVVTPEMRQARLVGRFSVSGGFGNDIQAGVVPGESEHLNYINGHQSRGVWFTPGRVTAESFDVSVPPGTYYLDFSNKFSLLAAKTVNLDVWISYQRLRFR